MYYCDYDVLADYATELGKIFNTMSLTLDDIDDCFNKIYALKNWDAETRDYFQSLYKSVKSNYEIVNSKFNNIVDYVHNVVDNNRRLDSSSFF